MLRFQVFRWTIHAGMQEGLLKQFNGTSHTHEKNPKHWIFKPKSLHNDINVSETPFQLRIGIAVPGFYAGDFTFTGINHLCHELLILIARLVALSCGLIKMHLGFLILLTNIGHSHLTAD